MAEVAVRIVTKNTDIWIPVNCHNLTQVRELKSSGLSQKRIESNSLKRAPPEVLLLESRVLCRVRCQLYTASSCWRKSAPPLAAREPDSGITRMHFIHDRSRPRQNPTEQAPQTLHHTDNSLLNSERVFKPCPRAVSLGTLQ